MVLHHLYWVFVEQASCLFLLDQKILHQQAGRLFHSVRSKILHQQAGRLFHSVRSKNFAPTGGTPVPRNLLYHFTKTVIQIISPHPPTLSRVGILNLTIFCSFQPMPKS
jgi:hypothetical protein